MVASLILHPSTDRKLESSTPPPVERTAMSKSFSRNNEIKSQSVCRPGLAWPCVEMTEDVKLKEGERERRRGRERVTVHYSQRLLKFTFRKAGLLRDLHDLQSQAGHTSSFYFRLVQSVGRGPSSATVSPLWPCESNASHLSLSAPLMLEENMVHFHSVHFHSPWEPRLKDRHGRTYGNILKAFHITIQPEFLITLYLWMTPILHLLLQKKKKKKTQQPYLFTQSSSFSCSCHIRARSLRSRETLGATSSWLSTKIGRRCVNKIKKTGYLLAIKKLLRCLPHKAWMSSSSQGARTSPAPSMPLRSSQHSFVSVCLSVELCIFKRLMADRLLPQCVSSIAGREVEL